MRSAARLRRSNWAALLTILPGIACASDWPVLDSTFGSADVRFVTDNNVTDAKVPSDIRSDNSLRSALSYGADIDLDQWGMLEGLARLGLNDYARFTGLDEVDAGASVAWRRKFGVGRMAPAATLTLTTEHASFDGRLRDGWLTDATVGLTERFAAEWSMSLEVGVEYRSQDQSVAPVLLGRDSDVFRQFAQIQRVGANWSVSNTVSLFTTVTRRRGDFDITIHGGPNADFGDALSVAADPTFGANSFAERVKAVSRSTLIGASVALSPHAALAATLRYDLTLEPSGDTYRRMLAGLAYSYHF